jgi:hypothetical protein
MILEELAGLLQASRFLSRGEPVEREALRALPELADGLPAVVFDARGPHVWSGCADAVRAAAAGLASDLAQAARAEPGPDAARQLASDPFVAALRRLVVEGARHSPGAAVVPLLEAVRCAQDAWTEPTLSAALTARDGAVLRRIIAAFQARLAAACANAATNIRVPALAWAVARARLLPLFPRGTLDRETDWQLVAGVLDVPLPAGTMEAMEAAVRKAVDGIAQRRASGRSTPDDAGLLLRHLRPSRLDAGAESAAAALVDDPDGIAALVPALGRFADAKALTAAGVDGAWAARLIAPESGLAVASVRVELLAALRAWDVLSQLVAALAPGPFKGLVVPRGQPTRAAVVAVSLARLRGEPGRQDVVDAAWTDLTRVATSGISASDGGLACFPDALDALRFALAARERLPGAAIALSWGPVHGGTDGGIVRLHGPAVDSAVRWLAAGPAPARPADGAGGLRQVGGWLAGSGIAVDAPAAEALQDARVRRGLATAADGPPGGDPRVPRSLDLHRAHDLDAGVLALVRIPGVTGGFEALYLSIPAWRALLDRDGERTAAAPPPAPAEEPAAVAAPAVAESDEDAGFEMAEAEETAEEAPVTLDLAEGGDEPVSAPAHRAGFQFDAAGDDEQPGETDANFSGFYLPSADAPPPPPPQPAGPTAATFEMLVEDDDELDDFGRSAVRTPSSAFVAPADLSKSAPPVVPAPARSAAAPADPFGGTASPAPASRAPAAATPPQVDPFAALADDDPFAAPPEPVRGADAGSFAFIDPFSEPTSDAYTPRSGPGGSRARSARPPGVPGPNDSRAPEPVLDPPTPRSRSSAGSRLTPPLDDPFAGFSLASSASAPATDPFLAADPGDPFAPDPPAPPPATPVAEAPKPARVSPPQPRPPRAEEPDPLLGSVKAEPGARAGTSGGGRGPVTVDFDFLLKGYACFFDKKEAVFGRPYGTRMVDRHAYPYAGDPDDAYLDFLRDKIREGFVPRADMVGDLPRGVTLMPLDPVKLQRAWEDLS